MLGHIRSAVGRDARMGVLCCQPLESKYPPRPAERERGTSYLGSAVMGNIFVVCSHRRGDDTVVLCCVSETEDGRAIAFQFNGLPIETDAGGHEFASAQEAEATLLNSTWAHA